MSDEACPLPSPVGASEAEAVQACLGMHRIAVVGASDDGNRAGNYVPAYLRDVGYEIVPVNPTHARVLGQVCHPSLAAVPPPVDLVLVFRRPEFCAGVAREAVAAGARGVWLQAGIRSAEAKTVAQEAGLWYVEDRCMMVEARRK